MALYCMIMTRAQIPARQEHLLLEKGVFQSYKFKAKERTISCLMKRCCGKGAKRPSLICIVSCTVFLQCSQHCGVCDFIQVADDAECYSNKNRIHSVAQY